MDFSGKLVLAPLAGITDSVYRRICRRLGADVTWSEMVSADGLAYGWEKNRHLLDFTDDERPLGIQLFGADPEVMAAAAGMLLELEPDFIDLNFGCPVRKVIQKNGGVSLMRDPSLAGRIASEVVKTTAGVPVTAKIRSGWGAHGLNYREVAQRLVEAGVTALAVHPRTREQGFSGRSDWSVIAELVRELPIPVIGSGDVFEPEDAVSMFQATGCSAVMIGRGALGNPWIFSRTRALLDGRPDPGEPAPREKFDLALAHARLMTQERGEKFGIILMRKHFSYYTRGLTDGSALRRVLFTLTRLDEVEKAFTEYLEKLACIPTGSERS